MEARRHDLPFSGFGKGERILNGRVLLGARESNAAQVDTIDIARSLARRASGGIGSSDLGWSHPRTSGGVIRAVGPGSRHDPF